MRGTRHLALGRARVGALALAGLALAGLALAGCGRATLIFDFGEGGGTGVTNGSGGSGGVASAAGGSMGCTSAAQCDDNDACTSDACNAGLCSNVSVAIDDNNACTSDSCDPVAGVQHVPVNPDDDNACTSDSCDPVTGVSNVPAVDCSLFDDQCNQGACDPGDGTCFAMPSNEGMPCDDMSSCSSAEVCSGGVCLDPSGSGYVFYEPFASNMAGWTLDNEWQIGPAVASSCALIDCPGEDPAEDHTSTADNGVAGVVIGGCALQQAHPDACLTSPPIDTTLQLGDASLSFWRHLHTDYPPFMTNTVQVTADGTSWTTLVSQPTTSMCINDTGWVQETYDVTSLKSATFQVRFCFLVGSGGVFPSGGWSVDDVVIGAPGCFP